MKLFKAAVFFNRCLNYAILVALVATVVAGITSRGAWLNWIESGLVVMRAGICVAFFIWTWSLWLNRSGRNVLRDRSRYLASTSEWATLKAMEQLNLAGILLILIPVHISIGITLGFFGLLLTKGNL